VLAKLTDTARPVLRTSEERGARARVLHAIGRNQATELGWTATEHNSSVLARWVFQRGGLRRFRPALEVAASDDPKFDAKVELNSLAYNQVDSAADEVVEAYFRHVRLKTANKNPYEVGSISVRPEKAVRYKHALHESYSGLTTYEAEVADELDKTRLVWARNPVAGGGVFHCSRGARLATSPPTFSSGEATRLSR
jgi:type III restriction enzyme